MRAARTITFTFDGPSAAYVRGHGSRQMIADHRGGRPPIWSATRRAWYTTPDTARDLIALCEVKRIDVVIEGDGDADA